MANDRMWDEYCNKTGESYGKPDELTGNALFARSVRATPLEADAILDLIFGNLEYFGDGYYRDITVPIEMRVAEYQEHKAKSPSPTLWVIMANDFPEAIVATKEEAEEFCNKRMDAQNGLVSGAPTAKLFWKAHPFVLGKLPA